MSLIRGADGNSINNVPRPTDVEPCGTQVLVELLTKQEALGTSLHVQDDVQAGAPQGYIRKLGPKVTDDWGFQAGDRVVLVGNFTPLPEYVSQRVGILVEPHQIKARLVE